MTLGIMGWMPGSCEEVGVGVVVRKGGCRLGKGEGSRHPSSDGEGGPIGTQGRPIVALWQHAP